MTLTEKQIAAHLAGYDAALILRNTKTGETLRHDPSGKRCALRLSPCSTFKIVNSLIGLETGVVSGPEYKFPWDGVKRPIDDWNQDQTLKSAFAVSAVWCYQEIARRVGMKRMRHYIDALSYGNRDLSGGLTKFWLNTSLKISAEEQIALLEKLRTDQLPFSKRSQRIVRNDLMVYRRTPIGVLRGKTGTAGDSVKQIATFGWYVGWVTSTKTGVVHLFALNLRGGKNPSGREGRGMIEAILTEGGLL